MFKPSKMPMLAFPKLIHVPVNLLFCLKAVGSQVLWFFIFCQRVKSVVSPLLLFTVALCKGTSRGPQCPGSDALDPAIPSLSREAREAGLSCLISPQAGSGSAKNNPSVMEALLPHSGPGRVQRCRRFLPSCHPPPSPPPHFTLC